MLLFRRLLPTCMHTLELLSLQTQLPVYRVVKGVLRDLHSAVFKERADKCCLSVAMAECHFPIYGERDKIPPFQTLKTMQPLPAASITMEIRIFFFRQAKQYWKQAAILKDYRFSVHSTVTKQIYNMQKEISSSATLLAIIYNTNMPPSPLKPVNFPQLSKTQ